MKTGEKSIVKKTRSELNCISDVPVLIEKKMVSYIYSSYANVYIYAFLLYFFYQCRSCFAPNGMTHLPVQMREQIRVHIKLTISMY